MSIVIRYIQTFVARNEPQIIGIFILSAIAAVVFSNQPVTELAMIGRALHLLTIALASAVLLTATRSAGVYVAVCAALFALGLAGERLPYETTLSVLFLGAGIVIGSTQRSTATRVVVTLTIVSGVVMLLQVAGAGEWTQALTTHGIIDGAPDVPKEALPTLFLGYYDVQANYLQGRPAGFLHSNQFASLVILLALALSISHCDRRSWLVDGALCVTAVLSLAKVVFLGLGLLVVFQYLRGARAVAFRLALLTGVSLVAYAILFPGMFEIFFFNLHNVWQSIAVRGVDVLATFGLNAQEIQAFLESHDAGMLSVGQIKVALLEQLSSAPSGGGRTMAYTALAPYAPVLYSAAAFALLIACMNASARTAALLWVRENVRQEHVSVLIVLGVFCLAANFLGAQIFWLIVGFAVPGSVLRPN